MDEDEPEAVRRGREAMGRPVADFADPPGHGAWMSSAPEPARYNTARLPS